MFCLLLRKRKNKLVLNSLCFLVERDPNKRKVKPVDTQSIINFEDLEESSDDSDFRIEDHPEATDDDDDSLNSGGNGKL